MDKNEMFFFYKNALQGAITSPLCAEYKNEWRGCGDNKEKLVKLVLRQQSQPYFLSHCYQGKGLSKEYILKEYGDFINGNRVINDADGVDGYTYSLYVGYNGDFSVPTNICTMMWCNNTNVTIEKTRCPTLYVGVNSDVHISLDGFNCPRIYLFDNSKVTIDDGDMESKVIIYKYSKDWVNIAYLTSRYSTRNLGFNLLG